MRLIDDWKQAYRLYSVQLLALLALMPDIYDGIAAFGWMDELPDPAKWTMRALGAAGIVLRVIRQGRVPEQP